MATGHDLLTRLRRNGQKPLMLDELVFGKGDAPSEECRQERAELLNKLRALAASYDGRPPDVWKFLCDEYEKYEPKRDGPSEAMKLVEDVEALREVEKEELAAQTGVRVERVKMLTPEEIAENANRVWGPLKPRSCTWCDKPAESLGEDGTASCGQGQGDGLPDHQNIGVTYHPVKAGP